MTIQNQSQKFMISQSQGQKLLLSCVTVIRDFPTTRKVEEVAIETLVDLPTEPTLELVPPLVGMMVSYFLRLSDVYDPLQIYLQESGSQKIRPLMV